MRVWIAVICAGLVGASVPVSAQGLFFGRVSDAVTGAPIGGATVTINERTEMTSSSGEYTMLAVPSGPYELIIEAQGYARHTEDIIVQNGRNVPAMVSMMRSRLEDRPANAKIDAIIEDLRVAMAGLSLDLARCFENIHANLEALTPDAAGIEIFRCYEASFGSLTDDSPGIQLLLATNRPLATDIVDDVDEFLELQREWARTGSERDRAGFALKLLLSAAGIRVHLGQGQ